MNLIGDIINELVDSEKSITSPLLKTKVLASRLKATELFNWTNNELSGYKDEADCPSYRKFASHLTCSYINGYHQFNNQALPTHGLPKVMEEKMRSMIITHSAATLEALKNENKSGQLEVIFSAEIIGNIQNNFQKQNSYIQILSAKKSVSINAATEITAAIRSKLLDFMLKMEDEFGTITEIKQLEQSKDKITTIMNQTIITNTGDGNVVNTGDNSKIEANIKITKGDKEALAYTLKHNGIEDVDAIELSKIIDEETPENNERFGTKVNGWVSKMLGKALDGSWQIGIGAAGDLLSDAIKAYYGI